MYPFELVSEFPCGDMTAVYLRNGETVGFLIVPTAMRAMIPPHQGPLNDSPAARAYTKACGSKINSISLEPLLCIKLRDDATGGSGDCCSLKAQEIMGTLKFAGQTREGNVIRTLLRSEEGLELTHVLTVPENGHFFEVHAEFRNGSAKAVTLELIESFNLGLLSPFQRDEGSGKYRIHRFRSFWSAEGRPDAQSAESLGLEASWSRFAARNLRFGQNSTKVVKEFFPSIAFEDTEFGVVWAAQTGALGPWQIELFRRSDFLNVSGGYPDDEFCGWNRRVESGETFRSMPCAVTCVRGSVEDAMLRLTERPLCLAETHPEAEKDYPVLFNEFCTTWCKPYPENLNAEIERVKGLGLRYFVLDDGWFTALGDWDSIRTERYPGGFGAFIESIRRAGMIPGLWFEMEHCRRDSALFREHPEYMLTLGGEPVSATGRFILDFRRPAVWEYMDRTMCKVVREYGIGYIKMDYNSSFKRADAANGSPAYATAEYTESVRAYFRHLKELFPELVLELCASGGHRLSPDWMSVGNMASFSDAHESLGIPLIGANTALQIPMSRNQIWATVREYHSPEYLCYLLASGFLGRLCLSGEPSKLTEENFAVVREGVRFYQNHVRPFVDRGSLRIARRLQSESYEQPLGWQAVARTAEEGGLYVIHAFGNTPSSVELPCIGALEAVYKPESVVVEVREGGLFVSGLTDFCGLAVVTKV